MTRNRSSFRRLGILAAVMLLGALVAGSQVGAHCIAEAITAIDYEFVDGEVAHTLTIAIDEESGAVTARLSAVGDGQQVELAGALDPATWEHLLILIGDGTAAFVDCPPTAPMSSVQLTTTAGSELASWCTTDGDPIITELAAVIRQLVTG